MERSLLNCHVGLLDLPPTPEHSASISSAPECDHLVAPKPIGNLPGNSEDGGRAWLGVPGVQSAAHELLADLHLRLKAAKLDVRDIAGG